MSSPVTVFISYSHDSDAHRERVLSLSERLRADGIETRLDQYLNGAPVEGWPRWMMNQVDDASFVLVACTETYYRRFRGREVPEVGKGADWEGAIITQHVYDARGATGKFVPILFDPDDAPHVPDPLRGRTCYALTSEECYQELYDVLLGQGGVQPAPVGRVRRRLRALGRPLAFRAAGPAGDPGTGQGGWLRRPAQAAAGAAIMAVVGAGVAYGTLAPGKTPSVAVLPLENSSPGGEFGYLADGLTEEIITRLASIDGLHVPSRRAVMRYRGASQSIPEIARDLDVAHVLDGSVLRDGERLRIQVQLRDRRDRQVWAEKYDRGFDDVLTVQGEIAGQIADALRARLTAAERARLAAAPTTSVNAYDLYLRGREHLYRPVGRQVRNDSAIPLFQQALRVDPDYALAYAGLARAYEERSLRLEMETWYDSAVAMARLAVQKAPDEERTHAALGYVLRAGGRHREALQVLRHAAALAPGGESPGSGRSNLGLVYQELGRPDSAVIWHRRAAEMEPGSVMARTRVGLAWEALGESEAAAREYERAMEVDSAAPDPRYYLALLRRARGDTAGAERLMEPLGPGQGWYFRYEWELLHGRWAAALRAWSQWRAGDGAGLRFVPPALALAYMGVHDTVRAQAALARAEAVQLEEIDRGHEGYLPRLLLAQVHSLRGDVRAADRWFAEAARRGYLNAAEAARLPALEALRRTRGFQARLREMEARAAQLRAGG